MKFSIGSWFGIPVYIHWSLVLFSVVLMAFGVAGGNVGFLLLLFVSILAHEFGHALMGRKFGIGTREIHLTPMGGVAHMERIPKDPIQEILVSLAGPAVNFGIAGITYFVSQGFPEFEWNSMLGAFFWSQIGLGLFNLIPVFPMDGGRILRSILQVFHDRLKATKISVKLAQVLAVVMGAWGVLNAPMLFFIAIFIWFSAKRELQIEEKLAWHSKFGPKGAYWDFEVKK